MLDDEFISIYFQQKQQQQKEEEEEEEEAERFIIMLKFKLKLFHIIKKNNQYSRPIILFYQQ